ncbi:hypothetical protein CC1G_07037 [Coprinopsis cinerea okayama7|uniref:Uncharacterized protein n=1 Tax=Coprinopsis cinerea (strain Okayama-7 / 130 / ATCC MYA-4618 / FGSC 9003) TaxID=240176 RepID=A8NAY4_COPC7|nr:hypothetical protein CC1G_07037 [Coprinopsis cinerea okayama7\|eukprot:XP_001831986.2 hypothetical protein CC1G_07037 [Coprinopsis cinerea okayama7\
MPQEASQPLRGYQLTASQVAYLRTRVDQYRDKKKKAAKEKVAASCARALKEDYEQMVHQSMSSEMEKSLRKAVAHWLDQNALSTKGAPKHIWGIRWHARLVFQHSNARAIMYLARVLASGPNPNIPNLRDLYEDPDLVIPPNETHTDLLPPESDEEDDEADDDDDDGVPATPFTKYQTATTLLWGALTEAERAQYTTKAEEWRMQGPPLEEKLRCADRFIRGRCMDFAIALHNDMDARVWLMVGFRDLKKEPVALKVEFNKELGGCKEAFSSVYADETDDLVEMWRDWVSEVYGEEARGETEKGKVSRVRGRPLVTLECDEHGRPLLPPLSAQPPRVNLNTWLGDIFRSYFTRYYVIHVTGKALPEEVPPNSGRLSAPWSALKEHNELCFDEECLDKDLWGLFKDPAHMKVGPQMMYYKHLFARQEDPSVDEVFRFKLAPVRSPKGAHASNDMTGYDFVPPHAREEGTALQGLVKQNKSNKKRAKGKRVDRGPFVDGAAFEGFSPDRPSSPGGFEGFSPPPQSSPLGFRGFSPAPSPSSSTFFGGFSPPDSPHTVQSLFGGFSPPPSSPRHSNFSGFSPPPQSPNRSFTFSPPPPTPNQFRRPSSTRPPSPARFAFSPPPTSTRSPTPDSTFAFSPPPASGDEQLGDDLPSTPASARSISRNRPPGKTPGSSRVPKNIGSGLEALPDDVLKLPRTTRAGEGGEGGEGGDDIVALDSFSFTLAFGVFIVSGIS